MARVAAQVVAAVVLVLVVVSMATSPDREVPDLIPTSTTIRMSPATAGPPVTIPMHGGRG